jgi:hypothetical protein
MLVELTIKVKIFTPQNFRRNKPMSHCKGQKCSFNWYGTSKPRSIACTIFVGFFYIKLPVEIPHFSKIEQKHSILYKKIRLFV